MYSGFYVFLTKYKLFFKEQLGFTKSHSKSHALISPTDLIKEYLDNDYFVCGVFIDLQKAFDTVNHDILLAKLDFYSIRGYWLKLFLENRQQIVNLPGRLLER